MKLAIIGSRTCPPVDIMLYLKHLSTAIISGGARGTDAYARDIAKIHGIELIEFLPQYDKFPSKVTPLMRNKLIVENSDCLLAFWDGESRGTKYTLDYAN